MLHLLACPYVSSRSFNDVFVINGVSRAVAWSSLEGDTASNCIVRVTKKTTKTIASPAYYILVKCSPNSNRSAANWKRVWVNVRDCSCDTG